jgi:hypothetical protein
MYFYNYQDNAPYKEKPLPQLHVLQLFNCVCGEELPHRVGLAVFATLSP